MLPHKAPSLVVHTAVASDDIGLFKPVSLARQLTVMAGSS